MAGDAADFDLGISWTPPPSRSLVWGANCDLFAAYIGALADSAFARPFDGPYTAATDLLRSALPANFTPAPTTWQLLEWHEALRPVDRTPRQDAFFAAFIGRAINVAVESGCSPPVCAQLEASSQLDADLAGTGVLVSYIIEALLVTIFALMIVMPTLSRLVGRQIVPPWVVDAFRGSTHELFVGAIILNLGIQLALLQKVSGVIPDGEADKSSFYRGLFRLVSAFSFLPVMVLFPIVSSGWRRIWSKRAVIALLWSLFTASNLIDNHGIMRHVLAPSAYLGESMRDTVNEETRRLVADLCGFRMEGAWGLWKGIGICMWIVLAAPIAWALLSLCLWITTLVKGPRPGDARRSHPRLRGQPVFGTIRNVIVAILCLSATLGMWLVVGGLLYVRLAVGNISPEKRQSNHWTFGQILAVATWIPVLIELCFMLGAGMKRGLEGHMPENYIAVRNEDAEDEYGDIIETKSKNADLHPPLPNESAWVSS